MIIQLQKKILKCHSFINLCLNCPPYTNYIPKKKKKATNEESKKNQTQMEGKRLNSKTFIIIKLKLKSFEISIAKAIQGLLKG